MKSWLRCPADLILNFELQLAATCCLFTTCDDWVYRASRYRSCQRDPLRSFRTHTHLAGLCSQFFLYAVDKCFQLMDWKLLLFLGALSWLAARTYWFRRNPKSSSWDQHAKIKILQSDSLQSGIDSCSVAKSNFLL